MARDTAQIDRSDPSRLLSVGEAARLAGVSESTLRRRMQAGEILHEVARGDGRQRPMVRLVELADAFPELRGAAPDEPLPEPAEEAPRAPAQRAAAIGAGTGIELAAVRAAHEALSTQVADLHGQRDDLKEQCSDLRGRLTIVEHERQAGTAGLLFAQKRLLEIEAGSAAPLARWYARGSTWGFAGALVVLVWFLRGQVVAAAQLDDQNDGLAQALVTERVERVEDARAFGRTLRVSLETAQSALAGEREAARDERVRFAGELEDSRSRRDDLHAALVRREQELTRERNTAEDDRKRFTDDLLLEREETERVRLALQVERAEVARERELFSAALERARERSAAERAESEALLESLRAGSESARETAEALASELARMQAAARSSEDVLGGAETSSSPAPWWARLWRQHDAERAAQQAAPKAP